MNEGSPAQNLLNLVLENGWKVIEIWSPESYKEGFFSTCYKVEKNGEYAFLKAYDIQKYFSYRGTGTQSMMDIIAEWTNSYNYERKLSEYCRDKKVNRVVVVKEAGEISIPNYLFSTVPYLIFDLAECDVRAKLTFLKSIQDAVWKVQSLHCIAVGLKQLHQIGVGHQDVKPANILVFPEYSKLGDLGRSVWHGDSAKHIKSGINGDKMYAPIELLYGFFDQDLKMRTYSIDFYLLSNLIVYYFTGCNLTAMINERTEPEFRFINWRGSYLEVLSYLKPAFISAIEDFGNEISYLPVNQELKDLVFCLANPDLKERGKFKNNNQYSMHPVVSKLNYIFSKIKIIGRTNGKHYC